ncbi:branched-chain amino acid ABC transporter permease [Pseudonocardia kunmingensis]|uniref:Amino acid/amide ABC transporter membrane protein 2 (HAAT family) n=1 Tax=Pseudonocardia kunmingensis TaxID=630975 RepID=A0A543E2B2_9PSEU|nr:branched-chain amino acid ABC transporter permease [Pseudonocardia kunmingensis]TQM15728.1 amino acid/amide ABC transporter membrane protein 2 (HAAT family) [Pseudonocardia kunmingensis]
MSETTTSAPPSSPEPPSAPPPARRRGRLLRGAAWLALLLVMLALPLVIGPGLLSAGQYVMVGAVGAIGLTLVIGQAGQLSLAHAFFLLVGGTSYAVLAGETEQAGSERIVGLGLPPLVALVGAVVISALAGLAFAPVAGRLKGIYLGVASLALVFLGFYLGQALPALTGGAASGRNPEPFSLFGFPFTNEGYLAVLGVPFRQPERLWYLFLAFTVIAFVLARGAVRSRVGRSWRAVRDNEAAAAVMGVDVLRAKAGAFAVSAAYAGLAGVMVTLWLGLLKPDESEFGTYGLNTSIAFLAMAIIGGLGSIPGAVVGALIVFGTPQFLTLFADELGLGDTLAGISPTVISLYVYGFAVILVVLFEPGGLAAIGRRIVGLVTRTGATAPRSGPPGEERS